MQTVCLDCARRWAKKLDACPRCKGTNLRYDDTGDKPPRRKKATKKAKKTAPKRTAKKKKAPARKTVKKSVKKAAKKKAKKGIRRRR